MKRLWFLLTDGLPRLGLRLLDDLRSRGRRCEWCHWFLPKDNIVGHCWLAKPPQLVNRQNWCTHYRRMKNSL